ncbi:MAG: hypothetical protein CVT67_03385 [Actinobacteria bacterium HGW-Actinobacteria-7]|nr:MAG: hypothetical protein CVT67_03385 [Actinobacteria bacterium HGW-Actinobacteria-7]
MSKKMKIILALVALVLVAGVAASFALGGKGSGPVIETATATRQVLAVTVTASGKVESGLSADVLPPSAGIIDTIDVTEGETVTAGTQIAQLETEQFELQVAQARAAYSQAKSVLANIGAQGATSASIAAAKANVTAAYQAYRAAKAQYYALGGSAPSAAQLAAARAQTAAASSVYNNAKLLYDVAYATATTPSIDPTVTLLAVQKDQAYAGLKAAQAAENQLESTSLSAARVQAYAGTKQAYAGWKSAKAQLDSLQRSSPSAQKAAARAGVAQASEALAYAQQVLDDATLIAPIDGVVLFNSPAAALGGGGKPSEGAAVSPQSAPFTVVDLGALKFTAEVDEADIDRIKVGMKASVTLDAFPGEDLKTQVTRINPAAQATATGGTIFPVELELIETGKNVLIGMKGDATVEVSSQGAALTIPVEALFSEGGTDYVYKLDVGKLKKTEITVGATTDTEVEVLKGLAENDVVALSGSTQYADGMSVRTK